MHNPKDFHERLDIIHMIENPVVALAKPVDTLLTLQPLTPRGPGIFLQREDASVDPSKVFWRKRANLLLRSFRHLDAIRLHFLRSRRRNVR